MEESPLRFFTSLRSKDVFDNLLNEFYSRADEMEIKSGDSSYWVPAIIDSRPDYYYIRLEDFLMLRASEQAQKLMAWVEAQVGEQPLDLKKEVILEKELRNIKNISIRLRKDFHLKNYGVFADHLDEVVSNLEDLYLKSHEETKQDFGTPIGQENHSLQLRWTGGVASLATYFFELSTNPFSNPKGPNLLATPKELETFILRNFVDEDGQPFSQASLSTYLRPSRLDKKGKRNRIPTEEIKVRR